jgi:hypothetical protein
MATVSAPNVYCIAIVVVWDWFMLWLIRKIYDKLNDYKFLHIKCSCFVLKKGRLQNDLFCLIEWELEEIHRASL